VILYTRLVAALRDAFVSLISEICIIRSIFLLQNSVQKPINDLNDYS